VLVLARTRKNADQELATSMGRDKLCQLTPWVRLAGEDAAQHPAGVGKDFVLVRTRNLRLVLAEILQVVAAEMVPDIEIGPILVSLPIPKQAVRGYEGSSATRRVLSY
jgi:hypothetical protein